MTETGITCNLEIGRVLEALEGTGRGSNTVVVLWSDNAWHIGEKGMTGKTTLWDRSTHVPLIFAGLGVTAGGRCAKPAELLDIYPTLIDLCRLPSRTGLEGHSLMSQLQNAAADRPWPAITTHNQGNDAARSEHWRYIRYADGSEELYDHRSDPNEWTNLVSRVEHTSTKQELARWLTKKPLPPAPGSAHRVLTRKDGIWMWEGTIGRKRPGTTGLGA